MPPNKRPPVLRLDTRLGGYIEVDCDRGPDTISITSHASGGAIIASDGDKITKLLTRSQAVELYLHIKGCLEEGHN